VATAPATAEILQTADTTETPAVAETSDMGAIPVMAETSDTGEMPVIAATADTGEIPVMLETAETADLPVLTNLSVTADVEGTASSDTAPAELVVPPRSPLRMEAATPVYLRPRDALNWMLGATSGAAS